MRCLSTFSGWGWAYIWLYIHTVITTATSPDLWELAEILPDASVQTLPIRFDWGYRTFQTASHVHVIHIWGVCAPSQVVDGHMASHSHQYHHRRFPRFVRVGLNPTWCNCANHATTLWLRLSILSNCIPCPCHTYHSNGAHFSILKELIFGIFSFWRFSTSYWFCCRHYFLKSCISKCFKSFLLHNIAML